MVSMQLNSWLSTQATPPVAEPTLRGLEAIAAADGWMVALVGMSIVFVALFLLFLVMVGLRRALEPRLASRPRAPAPASAPVQDSPSAGPPSLSPKLVAAVATAIRLEQRRQAASMHSPQSVAGSGWVAARSLQWASHQQIFLRPRR